ncbi:cytidylate kinase [Geothrix rubra]|uniref:Cytidylate kinase n=1 Tax=Geothrix rubra TaxID=2927977 RepID=A0ABQ5Q5A7_9BACT|nr:cytidylate kinase-like family protein [Geothrix rubra]GLH69616.1 cytidylate kinase [Geothrix rubra]
MAKPLASLVPSIEQRECAWTELQDRLAHPPRPLLLPSITLSREFGCEGYPLALHLKELLESASGLPWTVFDKALVDRVASNEKVSRDLLSHLGNESHAQDVLRAHFGFLTHDDAYAKVVKHLVQIAMAGCAILVGRGGAVACQDLTNCFHFRLVGGFDFRVRTIARRLEMPLAEAEELVRRQSKLREKFISECLHADITSPRWYDAVFNNERQPVESIAQACLRIVECGWTEKSGLKRALPRPDLVTP